MIQSEGTMPHVYIEEFHQERFNEIMDYLFPGESKSFIVMGRDIYSIFFSNIRVFKLRVGWWRI